MFLLDLLARPLHGLPRQIGRRPLGQLTVHALHGIHVVRSHRSPLKNARASTLAVTSQVLLKRLSFPVFDTFGITIQVAAWSITTARLMRISSIEHHKPQDASHYRRTRVRDV